MNKFIVVTTQRSGATFFCTCLDSHPDIRCPHEAIFSLRKMVSFRGIILHRRDRRSSEYYKYRKRAVKHQLSHFFLRKRSVYNFFEYIYRVQNNIKAVGFKASYNQVKKYPQIVSWIRENDVKIIHLVRENILKTILSSETKRIRNLAHSTHAVEAVKVYLDTGKLLRHLRRRARLIEEHRMRFIDRPYLEVAYESFVSNRDRETQRIFKFFGIPNFCELESQLVKLNPDSLEDIIINYEEVKDALNKTEFKVFLS